MRRDIFYFIFSAVLLAACTDTLYEGVGKSGEQQQGLQFAFTTTEMGDELMSIGGAGATRDGGDVEANRFAEHRLEGDNRYGLKVHRLPLPLVGIHRGAVRGESSELYESSLTRAGANEVVATDGTNFHDSLTIWGYTSRATDNVLFDQILLTKVRNWRNSVEWPYGNGDYMRFYAVAPSLESINMLATGGTYATAPVLTYTLPEKASELRDVLYGESDNIAIAAGPEGTVTTDPKSEHLGKDNKKVKLNFRHITTAIRFSKGVIPDNLTVKSITLSGVNVKGTYNPATDDPATGTKGLWSGQETTSSETTSSYTVSTPANISDGVNVYIDGGMTLFMIPQTLPSGAMLSVTLTEDLGEEAGENRYKDHTITCSLVGDVWKKGYTVNYKITVGELEEGYYLTAENKELEHSNAPVTSTLDVHSYHLYTDYSSGSPVPAYRPVKWVIDPADSYSTDGGTSFTTTRPTWLTDFHGVREGTDTEFAGGNPATATFTVAKQEYERSAEHTTVLFNNQKVDGNDPVDLSLYYPDKTSHSLGTANCYVVNRSATTYKFPLVYGNKTSDGTEAACFKDHTGATITKKLIKDQLGAKRDGDASHGTTEYLWENGVSGKGIEPTMRAVLLWQDVNGLISSVGCTPDAISFTIGQSTPGNAVIALQARQVTYPDGYGYSSLSSSSVSTYGDWETLWTWHIWMTDEVYKNDGSSNEKTYDSFYINGSTADDSKADHIAQLEDDNGTYKILPVNLGWVPDNNTFGLYKPRKVTVRLKQADGKGDKRATATVTITQHARQDLYTGTGTVYQWGRPTAFPAVHNIDGTKRKIYDGAGNDITDQFVLAQATHAGDAIGQPFHVLQTSGSSNTWFDVSSADYATANAMWNADSKTVYDPCPPGFRVPKASIFYGFSKTGTTVENDGSQLNMYKETPDLNGVTQRNGEQRKGGYFYLKANEDRRYGVNDGVVGGVVYMPATGEWMANKTVGDKLSAQQTNQTYGLYWTSDYKSGGSLGCGLWITPQISATGGAKNKPILGFFDGTAGDGYISSNNHINALRAIRPMKIQIQP